MAGTVRADDPAVILFTSGSEREPKGVVLSHRNLLANVAQARADARHHAARRDPEHLAAVPRLRPDHRHPDPAAAGNPVILYPSPLHYHVIPELAYERQRDGAVRHQHLPDGLRPPRRPYDFFNVRLVVMGAEPLREETQRLWAEKFGIRISEGYGLTESQPGAGDQQPSPPSRRHGRQAIAGASSTLWNRWRASPTGACCACGERTSWLGYLLPDQPGRLTRRAPNAGLGWHDTGDIARIDADGFVTILGRAKRFAKLGGEQISLATVEQLAAAAGPSINTPPSACRTRSRVNASCCSALAKMPIVRN
jgi:acyl-[acyl-carrier-protein]-phospholipid O-acyltransferase/long-chain-fatty-acid--[acyl-carrier-protein] ligase